MQVLKMNRKSESFYEVLGPVFGSRVIEQETHDRFYDDPEKEWYVIQGRGAASVKGGQIKNFWAVDDAAAGELIDAMKVEHSTLHGVVPKQQEKAFQEQGFLTFARRVNFIEVTYEKY